jgi:uncharacterized heparinase superfamily protein
MSESSRDFLGFSYFRSAYIRLVRRLSASRLATLPYVFGTYENLIVAPTDLRALDPFVAEEIFQGRFPLGGRVLVTDGNTPFSLELPSVEFANRLHSFGWLRHVRSMKSDAHCANARMIIEDWISIHGRKYSGIPWGADVLAQRIIAWLSHSPVVLKGAEIGFYKRFLKSLWIQVHVLSRLAPVLAPGEERFRAYIALAFASIALPSNAKIMRKAARQLDQEIEKQILPDGGHISRNPRVALELLLDLLPLRQTYINLGHSIPARLIPAIDQMYPALRFFRHNSGELALFNGATSTLANELMSVLRYDETAGAPFKALPYMQYHRLAVKSTIVIVDTGKARSRALSVRAHAGCLSFEMSSGKHRFIINSGAPRFAGEQYRQLARTTAAHSTVCLNDTSSCRISADPSLGPVFSGGVKAVQASRHDRENGAEGLCASHDGYLEEFGLLHERDIQVSATGAMIRGRDRFLKANGDDPNPGDRGVAVARFHIHPSIEIKRIDAKEVHLVAPDNETWSFSCVDVEILIEEDVFFADPSGIRRSKQLELTFPVGSIPEIQWVMDQVQ